MWRHYLAAPKINLINRQSLNEAAAKSKRAATSSVDKVIEDWMTNAGAKKVSGSSSVSPKEGLNFRVLLNVLSNTKSYRDWNIGKGILAKEIRSLANQLSQNIPQRFGCATADELATKLIELFRSQQMETKLREIERESSKEIARKLPGRQRHYGGYFFEDIAKFDEYLALILTRLASARLLSFQSGRQAFTISLDTNGKLAKKIFNFQGNVSISKPVRSIDVLVKNKSSEKELKSADDLFFSVVKQDREEFLVILVRAQYKREKAAAGLRKQTDNDVDRWARSDFEDLILNDMTGSDGKPMRFNRDRILFTEQAISQPIGVIQKLSLPDGKGIQVENIRTASGAELTNYIVPVDTRVHDKLIDLVLASTPITKK